MKKNPIWIVIFIVFLGLGYLHGVQPQAVSDSIRGTPEKIEILSTDEIFFPEPLKKYLENELNLTLSITWTRNWERIQARSIENSGVDLIFLPSYWSHSLAQQGFLSPFQETTDSGLFSSVSSDFISTDSNGRLSFLPIYWIKTGIQTADGEDFLEFLKSSKMETLFLLADEDLILQHFKLWKSQGLWPQVSQKKILTLQLDQLEDWQSRSGATERTLDQTYKGEDQGNLSALLIWGASIPAGSTKKSTIRKLLRALLNPRLQSEFIKQSPFNSALESVKDDSIPLHRRAAFIRDLRLKDSIILGEKDSDARKILRENFNFIL